MLCKLAENSKVIMNCVLHTMLVMSSLPSFMQMVCYQYWPTEHDTADVFNHFSVKLISETQESKDIIRRTLGVKDMNVCSFSLCKYI